MTLSDAIATIYWAVRAPAWAATNLDALADVLRDLSWLPDGEVTVTLPVGLEVDESQRLAGVLRAVEAETAGRRHPVRVV